jgi:hypothetical protein
MGDKSKIALYSTLLDFLQKRGIDLNAFGSRERGLRSGDAIMFVEMLASNQVRILGVEPWRKTIRGYSVDSLGVWEPRDDEPSSVAAAQHIQRLKLCAEDVVTIQF